MTSREERLSFCKKCENRSSNLKYGIICGLTSAPADFEETCPDFALDVSREEKLIQQEKTYNVDISTVSSGRRFANYLLDLIFMFILWIIIALITTSMNGEGFHFEGLEALLIMTLPFVLYYVIFESVFDQTPAKMITRTTVVTENGEKTSFLRIIGRSFCRLIPFEPVSFLFSFVGWHDSLSKTRVILKRRRKKKGEEGILDEQMLNQS